jgi:hypothetical protein
MSGYPWNTCAVSDPNASLRTPSIPMTTADALPPDLLQGRVINRATILTSRGHPNPHTARDGLAEWAQKNNFDAVVAVRLVATPEILMPGEILTEVKWAAYGTAIGW